MQRVHALCRALLLAAVGWLAMVPLLGQRELRLWILRLALCGLATVIAAVAVSRVCPGGPSRWALVAVIAGAAPIVDSARSPVVSVVIAALLGGCLGGVVSHSDLQWPRTALLIFGGALTGTAAWLELPRSATIAGSVLLALVVALVASEAPSRSGRLIGTGLVAVLALTATMVGATSPRAAWFGGGRRHGPRSSNEVALTFDDGPSVRSTLAVQDVLDDYQVKGTFFVVGSALDAAPDVERTLLEDGQLLGSHAYHHNTLQWMSPRYDELNKSLRSMKASLGICPTFFRPPHGFRTPFVARSVHNHHMQMVLWDVSASDWATTDAALVARRVLDQVRGGSIVLLHDGLDGNVDADRSVVVRALPMIITGLRARGLEPVRLDELLATPPYAGVC